MMEGDCEDILAKACIQSASLRPGTHSFSFWTHRMWNKGSNWMQKKNRMFMQITNARKNMQTAYFRREIEHSHFSQR